MVLLSAAMSRAVGLAGAAGSGRSGLRSAGDNRQHRMRSVRAVHVHPVTCNSAGKCSPFGFARIGIDVEMREVAARDVDSNAMPALEQIARRKCLDTDCVDFSRNHRRRLLPRIPIARTQYSVGEI